MAMANLTPSIVVGLKANVALLGRRVSKDHKVNRDHRASKDPLALQGRKASKVFRVHEVILAQWVCRDFRVKPVLKDQKVILEIQVQ
jgi:hypothetical protein